MNTHILYNTDEECCAPCIEYDEDRHLPVVLFVTLLKWFTCNTVE